MYISIAFNIIIVLRVRFTKVIHNKLKLFYIAFYFIIFGSILSCPILTSLPLFHRFIERNLYLAAFEDRAKARSQQRVRISRLSE